MKKRIYLLLIACLGCLMACSDDKEESLALSAETILLEASGEPQKVEVFTDNPQWRIVASKDSWITVERDSCYVLVGAEPNPTKAERTARVIVVSQKTPGFVMVTQKGSKRAIGDPYPDATNPIGVIYKVTDGGEHGLIMSLDMYEGAWSTSDALEKVQSETDGRNNTLTVIKNHKDDPDFTTVYPVFHWLYKQKNGENVNGEWYLPSYMELQELYFAATGCKQLAGTHNITWRNQFDMMIREAGGVPFTYDNNMHLWASSEMTSLNAYQVLFKTNEKSVPYTSKTTKRWVRAIRAF